MKQRMLFAAAVILFALSVAVEAEACGDKFLVVGRGARFQRGYVAVHPASVLLVEMNRTASSVLLPLRRAGHRVDVAHDSGEVRRAMAEKRYDIVLADWATVAEVRPLILSVAPSVLFLPVLNGASNADLQTAKEIYGCPLDASKQKVKRSFLARLDDVIEAKRKSRPANCEMD